MKNILVIEDDRYLREVVVEKLKKEEFAVYEAIDGKEGLELTMRNHPDAVILDIILPIMNGFEYLEKKREQPEIASIPVIIISNLGQKEDIDRGIKLGAKDYIVKAHFTPNDLIFKIKHVLRI